MLALAPGRRPPWPPHTSLPERCLCRSFADEHRPSPPIRIREPTVTPSLPALPPTKSPPPPTLCLPDLHRHCLLAAARRLRLAAAPPSPRFGTNLGKIDLGSSGFDVARPALAVHHPVPSASRARPPRQPAPCSNKEQQELLPRRRPTNWRRVPTRDADPLPRPAMSWKLELSSVHPMQPCLRRRKSEPLAFPHRFRPQDL